MSKLTDNFLAMEDFYDVVDIVDRFELQDVKKAVGEDIFYQLTDIVDNLDDANKSVLIYGTMDKLLSTNRGNLTEYHQSYPVLRVDSSTEEKEGIVNTIVNNKINKNLEFLEEELPTIGSMHTTKLAIKIINGIVAFKNQNNVDMMSLAPGVKELMDKIEEEGIKPEALVDKLYKADQLANDESEYVLDFFEDDDREPEEIIDYLIEL
nr:MAG TPA: hypothetical protein [Herelleviridae sp.]